jgi:uncharacterized repeat protein (TIGR01451 family)
MRFMKSTPRLIMIIGLLLSLSLFATPQKALAADCTWTGATGNWSETSNWSCGAVPGSSDAAIITNGGTVTLDMEVTVQDLTLGGYSTLGGSHAITVTNTMAWSYHTYMVGAGATNIASGATLMVTVGWGNYGNHYPILDTRTLNIAGTAILTSTASADTSSRLGLANGATIHNTGILDFQSDTGIAQDNGSTGSVNNSGTLRKSAGTGTSPVSGVLVNNTGTVQALSGTLSLAGGGTSTGNFIAMAGATLDFGGGTQAITLGPSNNISGAGSVSFSGGTTTIGGMGTYAVTGATVIYSNGTMNMDLDGTTANMTLKDYSTLGGSHAITVTNTMAWSYHTYMVGAGATNIASGATLTVTVGWGNYGNHYPILDTRTLNIAGTAILTSTASADTSSRLGLANGATIHNTGILDFQSDTGIAQDNGSTGSVNNSGTLRKSAGTGTSPVSGVLVNNTGTVQALSGTLSFTNFTQNSGVTMLNGGSLASVSNPLNFYGGTLQGVGTISGNVDNIGGTVSPGNSAGNLHISGNYTQGPTGALNIELGGIISVTEYDVLDVTGQASLDGELDISLINGYMPITGTVFRIMNFNIRSGDFVTETGTNVGDYLFLLPYYSPDHLYLIASTAIADLSVSITDGNTFAVTGDPITYTIVVTNAGPDVANGVLVTDTLPESISNVTWTCVASNGSCTAPSGSGNLSTSMSVEAGGTVTITITGRLSLSAVGLLVNTVTISHPADPNPANNSATDSDVVMYVKVYIPLVRK